MKHGNPQKSPFRRKVYLAGVSLAGIGLLVSMTVIATIFTHFGFLQSHGRSIVMRAVTGMMLVGLGFAVMAAGSQTLADAGELLDSEREANEPNPSERDQHLLLSDHADDDVATLFPRDWNGDSNTLTAIKIRCRECRAINDEANNICTHCGQML